MISFLCSVVVGDDTHIIRADVGIGPYNKECINAPKAEAVNRLCLLVSLTSVPGTFLTNPDAPRKCVVVRTARYFFTDQAKKPQEYFVYFKALRRRAVEKDPLLAQHKHF